MSKKIFLIFVGLLIPLSIAFALEIAWPPSPMGTNLTDASTLTELSRYLYEWGIALGGLAAFIALLIAGFLYLTSVGDPQKLADARGRIIWALAGLVLLFAAWLILNTINPDLTRPRLEELLPSCDASSTIDTAVTPCPVVTDPPACCEPNYICIGDKNPWDGDPKGICVLRADFTPYSELTKPSCRYARIFERENFDYGGANRIANFGENARVGVLVDTRSIKSFYDDGAECATSTPQAVCAAVFDSAGNRLCDWNPALTTSFGPGYHCFRDCGPDACGCRAELYDLWTAIPPCWESLGYISAYEKSLVKYSEESIIGDGKVDCVMLRESFY